MREQLIRYLLGELDADERRELRAMLRDNPELQKELEHLRECFATSPDGGEDPLPPRNLAARTAERVVDSDEYELEAALRNPARQEEGDRPAGVLGWNLADLAVAGGVILAVSMLVFPGLINSRDCSRRTTCQHNLYQLWVLDSNYALNHGGFFPQVRPNENTGMIAARLIEGDYEAPERLAVLLVCPASHTADLLRATGKALPVPTKGEMQRLSRDGLVRTLAHVSPCYGFRLAQKVGDDYVYPRSGPGAEDEPEFDPLIADVCDTSTSPATFNHRGKSIQVIGRDGSLKSFTAKSLPKCGYDPDIYHNDLGFVDVGVGLRDAVLAPSDALPALDLGWEDKLK
ncbi:MAG TPA: hypothetical protein VH107_17140 [Lacipirellulaceae bacterium]|jgi:hypothetical protein|nr:hypothetical protein [Lacipirellulaceae bacterium]